MTHAFKSEPILPIRFQRAFDFFKTKVVRISFLLILQAISWKTTVTGSEEIFASIDNFNAFGLVINPGIAFGTGIQAILVWLFLAGEAIIKPRQKLYALIAAYTAVSIYASFFYTYQGVSGEDIAIKGKDRDKVELQALEAIIKGNNDFKDAKERIIVFNNTRQNKITQRDEMKARASINYSTEDVQRLDREIEESASNFNSEPYKAIVEMSQEAIDELDRNLKVRYPDVTVDRLVDSQKIIDSLPASISSQVNTQFEAKIEKTDGFFLPIKRLLSLNSSAIIALFLASIADLTSFLLGTAEFQPLTEKEKEEGRKQIENFFVNPVKSVCSFVPTFIEGTAHFIFVLIRSFGELANGLISGLISARKRAFQAFVYTPNKIGIGKDSDKKQFFRNLRSSIFYKLNRQQEETVYLDFEQLISDCGSNFVLIDACHKAIASLVEVGWIKRIEMSKELPSELGEESSARDRQKQVYKVERNYRDNLLDWLNMEERSMCQQRELDSPSASYTNLVYLPSHYSQANQKKTKHYARRIGWAVDRLFT